MYGYGYAIPLGVAGGGVSLPVNTVAPAITGTAEVGQTLTCSTGTWSGSPTYAYQWKRGGVNIGGATNSTYTLVAADAGTSIKCTVTATNGAGSATADSNTVSVLFNKYSMTFDGVDEAITTGNIDFTSAISISFWIKTTDTGSINSVVAKDNTGSSRSWNVYWRGSDSGLRKLYISIWNTNGTVNTIESTANILDDNAWHHVLCTYDGTANANGMKMYIDGVLDKQGTAASTGIKSTTATVTIGKLSDINDWYLSGSLDEVAIWNTDQSANISTIYNSGDPASLSSLSPNHWWRMGDGDTFSTNWTLVDNGSGGVNGTSVNMESGDRTTNVP